MRLLVDSHVALWWLEDGPRLGRSCADALRRADVLYFSAASIWELGIKQATGKLTMPEDPTSALESAGLVALPITVEHATAAPALPPHHRDPFDRMLIAQARAESLTLVTADESMTPYDVEILDARL